MRPYFHQPLVDTNLAITPHLPEANTSAHTTSEGIKLKPRFTVADLINAECGPADHVHFGAGIPPDLLGTYASLFVWQLLTIRQYAGFSTAEASNSF
ncbi:MAG: methylmalonyl-CoA mutase large subunit, partial [Spirosoma sp.]|nr:methylmalonyl-CoA mutase large subunit [Spirosoma sp.]